MSYWTQISNNDYLYLPFFLLIILCSNYTTVAGRWMRIWRAEALHVRTFRSLVPLIKYRDRWKFKHTFDLFVCTHIHYMYFSWRGRLPIKISCWNSWRIHASSWRQPGPTAKRRERLLLFLVSRGGHRHLQIGRMLDSDRIPDLRSEGVKDPTFLKNRRQRSCPFTATVVDRCQSSIVKASRHFSY